MESCSVDDCDNIARTRGWCGKHYTRWQRHGSPTATTRNPPNPGALCSVPDCGEVVVSKGLCRLHYGRLKRKVESPRKYIRGPVADRFWARVDRRGLDECWPWVGARSAAGYGQIMIEKKPTYTHRLSMEIATGEQIPAGMSVLHSCDNPPCCNPAHLRIGTDTENTADKMARGRAGSAKGEASPKAKLTVADVRQIRTRYAAGGVTQQELARQYGVKRTAIYSIVNRRSWATVG